MTHQSHGSSALHVSGATHVARTAQAEYFDGSEWLVRHSSQLSTLNSQLCYFFRNPSLLLTALTHSSYVNEHPREQAECYERLEFLGDSILGAVTAEWLYSRNPPLSEGRMTRIRAELVCEESLHRTALSLNLGPLMRLGRGEERTHGRERPSVLADMVEALIAAMWLDGGREEAKAFILGTVLRDAESYIASAGTDHKSELQELVQQTPGSVIRYSLLKEEGPDHDKRFTMGVYVNGALSGEGTGRSKKDAEQAAAASALKTLRPAQP